MARTAKKAKTEKVPEEEGKACPEGARSTSSNEGGNDGSNHDDSNDSDDSDDSNDSDDASDSGDASDSQGRGGNENNVSVPGQGGASSTDDDDDDDDGWRPAYYYRWDRSMGSDADRRYWNRREANREGIDVDDPGFDSDQYVYQWPDSGLL